MTGFFWLASYPKSGNTWLRLALSSVQNDGAAIDFTDQNSFAHITANRRLFDSLLGVESSDLTQEEIQCLRPRTYEIQAAEGKEPIFNKVHDAWHLTPAGEPLFPPAVTLGSLYILRDPRDVAVSFAAHQNSTIDDVIGQMGDPSALLSRQTKQLRDQLPQFLGSWSFHVTGWLTAGGARPPLLIQYESMLADPRATLRRVLTYLEWDPPQAVIDRAVAATAFGALRAAEEANGFREKPSAANRFFRRGIAGGWRDSLTDAQRARIEADHGDVMRRFGYL